MYRDPLVKRQKDRERHRLRVDELRELIFAKLGRCCSGCGFADVRALQIDHVNGNGYQDRKNKNTTTFLKQVLTDVSGMYQILCANCNWIKRHEKQEVRV